MTTGDARYRLIYPTPEAERPDCWAFCSEACEAADNAGDFAPDYCEGCHREIPSLAEAEGRLTTHFQLTEHGDWRCRRCAAPEEGLL